MTPEIFSVMGVGAVALVAFLTQVMKKYVPQRYHPLVPLVIGILVMVLANTSIGLDYILAGIVLGGMAISAFDVVRYTVLNNPAFGKAKK